MLKVGITGGIGSGKTIVSSVFRKIGIPVYNADEQAKLLIVTNQDIRKQILSVFGTDAYNDEGYNRKYIALKVFKNKSLLEKLNNIVHPFVANDFAIWTKQYSNVPYVLEEAAILFESGANKKMDYTILVDAPINIRISRITERDGLTSPEIEKRMDNQLSTDKIKHLVDWIIVNDNKQLILPQILKIHQQLIK